MSITRPGRPDDGSPARVIAAMIGIVGILLLGSLAWSAVAALFGALGQATASIANRPTPTRLTIPVAVATATPVHPTVDPTVEVFAARGTETVVATLVASSATPVPTLSTTPSTTPSPRDTPVGAGRAPWILLPRPEPDTHVAAGPLVVEARGRGDAPITTIRLELDGSPLPVSLEQRSDTTWRGFASIRVSAGQHVVRATVVDEAGRSGGYRWAFQAGP